MTRHTDVVTANVLCTVRLADAREALRGILDGEPDLVGLQEWGLSRQRLLRETGTLRVRLMRGSRSGRGVSGRSPEYVWVSPLLGGCPVGARADRFELVEFRSRILGWFGRSDRGVRPVPILPLRIATVAVFRDNRRVRTVSVVNFHLVPGVQTRGRYRQDRPLLVARHQREVRNLGRIVGEQLALGHVVYAMGDSNFDGLRLAGLTSAWEGRESGPGTLGSRRKIDDVHGPGLSTSVTLLTNGSDHKAVVVRREDLP